MIAGRWLADAGQHRHWLRDSRLAAYSELLVVFDQLESAAQRHLTAVENVITSRAEMSASDNEIRQALIERWNEYIETRRRWDERKAAVELAGTSLVENPVFVMEVLTGVMPYLDCLEDDFDGTAAWDASIRWADDNSKRRQARREFVAAARVDVQAVAWGAGAASMATGHLASTNVATPR